MTATAKMILGLPDLLAADERAELDAFLNWVADEKDMETLDALEAEVA